jgi:anti-anti-sigma factor
VVTVDPILSAASDYYPPRFDRLAPGARGTTALNRPDKAGRDRLGHVERPELSIAIQRAPDEVTLCLAGEIDVFTVVKLSATVNDVLGEQPQRILLDMSGVTFCDSQGLGTLVVLSRKAQHARSVLTLVNVGEFLMRVLDITGLRSALMISSST